MTPLLAAHEIAIAGRLEPASLTINGGELVALIGPNGGGKTSLLRALARVDGASGVVALEGEPLDRIAINRRRRLLSFLPAGHDIAWPVPVRDYVALSGADSTAVEHWLNLLELGPMADRPIDRLSTGERSRAMLARALSVSPRLLLLDEPLSNLEPYWVLRMLDILRDEAGRGATVLASLHDLHRLDLFDRVLIVADGRIQADSEPAEVPDLPAFEQQFRVSLKSGVVKLSQPEGRQSSP